MEPKTLDFKLSKTTSFLEAQKELSDSQIASFEDLVSDYQIAALSVHGWKISSPKVLAELIKLGWRKI